MESEGERKERRKARREWSIVSHDALSSVSLLFPLSPDLEMKTASKDEDDLFRCLQNLISVSVDFYPLLPLSPAQPLKLHCPLLSPLQLHPALFSPSSSFPLLSLRFFFAGRSRPPPLLTRGRPLQSLSLVLSRSLLLSTTTQTILPSSLPSLPLASLSSIVQLPSVFTFQDVL